MNRVVVFGATGFIGRNFVSYLSKSSQDLIIVCPVRKSSRNKEFLNQIEGLQIHEYDVLSRRYISDFLEKQDIVVDCIGWVGQDRDMLFKGNEMATLEVLYSCWKKGVSRVVYLSSVAVLSGNRSLPLRDNMPLLASMPYGESKLKAEKICWGFIASGLDVVILRPAMVYGRGEPHMLPTIRKLMQRGLFWLFGKADNLWHLCGIDNLVSVMEMALWNKDMPGRAFIVADEEILMAREIFNILSMEWTGKPVKQVPESISKALLWIPGLGRVVRFMRKRRIYDISPLKALGYKDVVPVRDGLKKAATP